MSKYILLCDQYEDGKVDAIIKTETTTVEQLQDALYRMKAENPDDYNSEMIPDYLPEDCEIVEDYDSVSSVWW